MEAKVIENIKIYVVEESDRYIAVSRKDGAIININYMQGCHEEELKYFKNNYLKDDKELTKFCLTRLDYTKAETEIKAIDDLIWLYIKREQIQEKAIHYTEMKVDLIFSEMHDHFLTQSGDITPTQQGKLDEIKEQLALLVAEQVHQNL